MRKPQIMPAPLRIHLDFEQDRTLRELSSAEGVARRVKERAMALRLNAQGWNDRNANCNCTRQRLCTSS